MSDDFDPLQPRPLDLPTVVPLGTTDDLSILDGAKIFAAPTDPSLWEAWRDALTRWREEARRRHAYDDSLYRRPDLEWASRCYVVSQVWLYDELLYDWEAQRFTPDRLVADALTRFGGFDGVVLWHAYPVIGIDDRNQWDYYREVDGLDRLIADLHDLGVKVFVDYNPWDVGTRRGRDDAAELASLVRDLHADGVFLDTLKEGGDTLLDRLAAARPGVAVEGESTLPLARLADHPLSWAQWFADSPVPGVVRSHLFERRHLLHHVRRWNRSHVEELQSAWLNGVGVMVWEVVFGVWVGWSDHDARLLRRMAPAQRALTRLLVEGSRTPLLDLGQEAYAARIFGAEYSSGLERLVTLVNRGSDARRITVAAEGRGLAYDVWTGREVPVVDGTAQVCVPGRGIGGLWETAPGSDKTWLTELDEAGSPSPHFPHRTARRRPAPFSVGEPTGPYVVVSAGTHVLTVRYRNRETGMYAGAPFVDEWKPLSPRLHDQRTLERLVTVARPVAVAATDVSHAEYAAFVGAAGGSASARGTSGGPPAVEVDLAGAREYAEWLGARLPTEDEWQLAASMAGFRHLAPRVWNLTESEHTDGRSRFAFLKGGADHCSEGSSWYFDGGPRDPEFSAKYLLCGGRLGRSTSVGFRVAWDLPEERSA